MELKRRKGAPLLKVGIALFLAILIQESAVAGSISGTKVTITSAMPGGQLLW